MNYIQRIAKALLGPYTIFIVLSNELNSNLANPVGFDLIHAGLLTSERTDPEAIQFCYSEENVQLCTCAVWFGEKYRTRNYWPLKSGECKLISLETSAEARGRGIAPLVLHYATRQMAAQGFNRVYARVWHSNAASLRAFSKAGWRKHAVVIEVFPVRRKIRIVIPYI